MRRTCVVSVNRQLDNFGNFAFAVNVLTHEFHSLHARFGRVKDGKRQRVSGGISPVATWWRLAVNSLLPCWIPSTRSI